MWFSVSICSYYYCVCGSCLDIFFFCKQKTAYEMRISDWSSDVCSSDLQPLPALARTDLRCKLAFAERLAGEIRPDIRSPDQNHHGKDQDRKSVVWGKSVSVRVDLGGRRIITKNKSE